MKKLWIGLLALMMLFASPIMAAETADGKLILSPFCFAKIQFIGNSITAAEDGYTLAQALVFEKDVVLPELTKTMEKDVIDAIMMERDRLIHIIFSDQLDSGDVKTFMRDEAELCMMMQF